MIKTTRFEENAHRGLILDNSKNGVTVNTFKVFETRSPMSFDVCDENNNELGFVELNDGEISVELEENSGIEHKLSAHDLEVDELPATLGEFSKELLFSVCQYTENMRLSLCRCD